MQAFFKISGSEQAGLPPDGMGLNGMADTVSAKNESADTAGSYFINEIYDLTNKLKTHGDEMYEKVWALPDNPLSKALSNGLPAGSSKKPIFMPVDLNPLRPLAQKYYKTMEHWAPTKKDASDAWLAINKILEGPRYVPAENAEFLLSGLKAVERGNNAANPIHANKRNTSQGIAAAFASKLQEAIDSGVGKYDPARLAMLKEARATNARRMHVSELFDSLPNNKEPVQIFNYLATQGDANKELLLALSKEVPGAMPIIGRAYLDKLLDLAEREGGFSRTRKILESWNNLGRATKNILYSDSMQNDIGNFLKGADMIAAQVNPSGTELTRSATDLSRFSTVLGWAKSIVGRKLYDPDVIKYLAEVRNTPARNLSNSLYTKVAATRLAKLAGIHTGEHGPILAHFRGKPTEAVNALRKVQDGEVPGAFHQKDVGPIDLIWGFRGTAEKNYEDGFGLAKIDFKHPGVADRLQKILDNSVFDWSRWANRDRPLNRLQLVDPGHIVKVNLRWNGKKKTWLLTSYEERKQYLKRK